MKHTIAIAVALALAGCGGATMNRLRRAILAAVCAMLGACDGGTAQAPSPSQSALVWTCDTLPVDITANDYSVGDMPDGYLYQYSTGRALPLYTNCTQE